MIIGMNKVLRVIYRSVQDGDSGNEDKDIVMKFTIYTLDLT